MSPESLATTDVISGVSRETLAALHAFDAALRQWTRAINLIAPDTVAESWNRHIIDSIQIAPLLSPRDRKWVDVGSGGGLPAIPLAIVAREKAPGLQFHLVESDTRKAAFLKTQAHLLGLSVTVHAKRAETLAPLEAGVLSCRAFAPLKVCLGVAMRHLVPGGRAVVHKGGRAENEIAEARETWDFEVEKRASVLDPLSSVLIITRIAPKEK